MLRVLIAEDEPPIMRSVKSAIEKTDADFSVEKCCINGAEAKEALEKESFDIVITDIKMPVMTGIELAGWIHENKPKTMVILLSGYSDFEYAKKALEYKVFDYILKPISRDKVKKLTERIKAELDKNKPKTITDDEKSTVVMLACAGTYLLHGADVLMPGERFWGDEAVDSIMTRMLNKGEEYVFFNTNVQSERIVVVSTESEDRQEEIVKLFAENLEHTLPVTIVYKSGVKFKNAGKSISALREQLIKKLVLGKTQIIPCNSETETYENISSIYSKDDIENICSSIRSGKEQEVKESLGKLLYAMRDGDSTQEEVIGLLNIILDTYTLNYPDKIRRKNSSVKREFITALAGFTTYDALIEDTASILMTLKAESVDKDKYKQLSDEVEEYILKNYNKSITSEMLSKEFGFVPSYISRIFKREKGVSPSEFIMNCRIKMAKKLLSENPNVMVKEVADKVGFNEAYYFSKTFKRETGMWPTEYAKKK